MSRPGGGRRVVAVVPARGGSKGLPGKNLALLGGRPLVAWPVGAALAAATVDDVVVSTDDAEIAASAQAHGAEVPFVRPPLLATDTAPSGAVVEHALATLAGEGRTYDYVVLLQPTCPFTEPADIDAALAMLAGNRDRADALVGLARAHSPHPAFALRFVAGDLVRPHAADDFAGFTRRQDAAALYYPNGALYASAVDTFLATGTFYHQRTMGMVFPKWKSVDIDDALDLVVAEAILGSRDHTTRDV